MWVPWGHDRSKEPRAYTLTHRLAALLQLHDLGPQLGSLPLLLFIVLHPECQHLRQLGHLLAGLRWGGVRRGQPWFPGSSVSQMPPSTCTPQLAPSTRGSTGLSIPHSGLLFNKHLLTDTEQGVGQAVSKTWPQPTLSSRLVWRLREKEITIVRIMDWDAASVKGASGVTAAAPRPAWQGLRC